MSDDTPKRERWLVFETDHYEEYEFVGEYPSMEAVEVAYVDKMTENQSIDAYGVIDDEPLRIYRLIYHRSGLPEGIRGYRVQIAWTDKGRDVLKMLHDETVLNYTVDPPPGYWEILYPEHRLEPIPQGNITGMWGTRAVDPL